jgi:hypothetical protein
LSVIDRESARFTVRSGTQRARRSVSVGASGRRWAMSPYDGRRCRLIRSVGDTISGGGAQVVERCPSWRTVGASNTSSICETKRAAQRLLDRAVILSPSARPSGAGQVPLVKVEHPTGERPWPAALGLPGADGDEMGRPSASATHQPRLGDGVHPGTRGPAGGVKQDDVGRPGLVPMHSSVHRTGVQMAGVTVPSGPGLDPDELRGWAARKNLAEDARWAMDTVLSGNEVPEFSPFVGLLLRERADRCRVRVVSPGGCPSGRGSMPRG